MWVPCAISSEKYLMAPGNGVAAASPRAQNERPAICEETSLIFAMSSSLPTPDSSLRNMSTSQ